MNIHEIILSLHNISDSLCKIANDPENYNCYASQYVQCKGWELYKTANELKAIRHLMASKDKAA